MLRAVSWMAAFPSFSLLRTLRGVRLGVLLPFCRSHGDSAPCLAASLGLGDTIPVLGRSLICSQLLLQTRSFMALLRLGWACLGPYPSKV